MPISIDDLRAATSRPYRTQVAKSLREAVSMGKDTVFLCHSHNDRDLVQGVQALLMSSGWDVYVDWQDTSMPDRPNRETAERIQQKIHDLIWFLFLATPNSTRSRWCPWEIGFANGVKPIDSILVIATTDRQGTVYGNEYLDLYRRIDFGTLEQRRVLAAFPPAGTKGTLVENLVAQRS